MLAIKRKPHANACLLVLLLHLLVFSVVRDNVPHSHFRRHSVFDCHNRGEEGDNQEVHCSPNHLAEEAGNRLFPGVVEVDHEQIRSYQEVVVPSPVVAWGDRRCCRRTHCENRPGIAGN